MSDDKITVEVNGVPLEARKGEMLIEVTDRAGIYIPRFCYHRKLSVAANCRMCLVDVEKAPKPLPACATPVADGMKVYTRSKRAISAQKATMEFLLINHPLDCPICDQGGECELQDLAMGFGRDVSRYVERKRVVKDQNLGPLVSTDMTRCIHCTRCVRFGAEIQGIQELGTIGRTERVVISTYVERGLRHELSGNVIDLCPVGALNNKPYRYSARPWEMTSKPLVAAHDCVGSNIYAHVLRGRVKRVVPRHNDSINETWISDRDRFSCHGLYTEDRLAQPMIKVDQEWTQVTWQQALEAAAGELVETLAGEGESLGVLVSPNATVEEMYLLRRIADRLGSRNIDHRLRRRDFRDQNADPVFPWLGCSIEGLERRDSILVVGSNLRMEVPLIAHRVRNAALDSASVTFVNPVDYTYYFEHAYVAAPVERMVHALGAIVLAAAEEAGKPAPAAVAGIAGEITVGDEHRAAAKRLLGKERALILLGHIAQRHPQFSDLRSLSAALAALTGAEIGYIAEGANGAGGSIVGVLPHRGANGAELRDHPGLDVQGMISAPRRAYVLFGIEPGEDVANGERARQALKSADSVITFSPYVTPELLECSTVLLPIGTFAETAGTFVNAEGRWQSFEAAADPVGEARPGWRVLRVLANLLGIDDVDYRSAAEVLDAARGAIGDVRPDNRYSGQIEAGVETAQVPLEELDVPIYSVDAVVRRSEPLQRTIFARGTAAEHEVTEVRLQSAG
ncbi:MAG TPA: NADH-quinone oxidoreductase subunit NuoG [Gammaproteobacteria bacterium]